MPSEAPRCSIVIRCFNESKHIGTILHGIREQTVRDVEIILVDSGSTDGTLEIAAKYDVTVLHIPPEQFSFGRSLNLGCARATAPFIAIASAHVYPVRRDWLANLLEDFNDPRVALVYGRQVGAPVTKFSEHQIFDRWFPLSSNPDQKIPFCNNANAAIRRSLWEKQPYDEGLTGLEDIAWAKRVLDGGHRIVYRADAPIVHVHEETWKRVYNRYRREAIALHRIYPHERFGLGHFLKLYIANVASDYSRAARGKVLLRNLGSVPMFRLMQLWGTYRGFRHRGAVDSELQRTFYYANGFAAAAPADDKHPSRIEYPDAAGGRP